MKIIIIDNYDSFTYNLVHYVEKIIGKRIDVYRNDKISIEDVGAYDKIIISPGPGVPDESGITKPVIAKYGSTKSILGVCLGHQAIGEVYGGTLINLPTVYHGIATQINRKTIANDYFFDGIPMNFEAGRYHSWAVSNDNFPDCLEITATTDDGQIMAMRHKIHDVYGVQFHPESVLTKHGYQMIENWLNHV